MLGTKFLTEINVNTGKTEKIPYKNPTSDMLQLLTFYRRIKKRRNYKSANISDVLETSSNINAPQRIPFGIWINLTKTHFWI